MNVKFTNSCSKIVWKKKAFVRRKTELTILCILKMVSCVDVEKSLKEC